MKPVSLTPFVSLFLIPTLIASPIWAQSAPSLQPASALQLKVVESDGAQVSVNTRASRGYTILVTDGSGVPVSEAAVVLRLPDSGPSGLFADGSHSAVSYTDAAGLAHVDGIQWNATAGTLSVRLTATKGDGHAGILLEQALVTGAPGISAAIAPPRMEAPKIAVAQGTPSNDEPAELNSIPATMETAPVRPAIRAVGLIPGVSVITDRKSAPMLRSAEPSVSISNDGTGPAYHGSSSKKKWIILAAAIAAGAGAAFAVSTLSKGSTTASSSSISIGTPTVSVGHP